MGIGEAGYYAGMIYYLSFWYKRYVFRIAVSRSQFYAQPSHELAMRIRYRCA